MSASKTRFAFVSAMGGSPWGGSEELWSQAAGRLATEGYPVAASVHFWGRLHPNLEALEKAGAVLQRRAPNSLLWQRGLAQLLRQPWAPFASRWAKRLLLRLHPTFVCISQGAASDGLHWMLACLEAGVPYVVIAHSVSPWLWPQDEIAEQLLRGYQGAKRCFFVSGKSKELFEDQVGEELTNARVVRNPFKVPYDVNLPWPDCALGWRLACLGLLEPTTKGQDLLLRVLGKDKWRQRPIKVSLYGGGPCEGTLRRMHKRLGLENVEFKGQTEDIAQVWKENHALLITSRVENMPLALVEAMLCSRVPIVPDVGGITELVEHGRNGFVAPAPTVELLAAVLEEAWQRREDWEAMGMAARKRVVSLVPPDPVKDFCEQLLALAAS